jgi:hypothetical protein
MPEKFSCSGVCEMKSSRPPQQFSLSAVVINGCLGFLICLLRRRFLSASALIGRLF